MVELKGDYDDVQENEEKQAQNIKQFCAWAGLVNCLFILMPTCIYILAQEADPKCLVDFSPGVSSVFSLAYPV